MTGADILRLGAIALAGTFCGITLRRERPELAMVLALVTATLLLWESRGALEEVLSLMEELAALSALEEGLLAPLAKTVGISVLVKLSAQLAQDGGMGGVASFLELAGSLAVLVASAPLLRAVLELLEGLL